MKTRRALTFAFVLSGLGLPALANPYAQNLTAQLLPGWRDADGRHVAGLELILADGWKTYWRNPGEGGIPPQFSWSGSANLKDVSIVWPRPHVFDQNGLQSIGYKHRVVFPLIVEPQRAGRDIRLNGEIQLGICETVCVPLTVSVSGALPADASRRSPRIAAALAQRPYTSAEAGMGRAGCRIVSAGNGGITVETRIHRAVSDGSEIAVIEMGDPSIWVAPGESRRDGSTLVARSEMTHVSGGSFAFDRSAITITVLGSEKAVELDGCDPY